MIATLIKRRVERFVNDLWEPRVGDYVEFVRTPSNTMGNRGTMTQGERATIAFIEPWEWGTRVTFSKDDGSEAIWEFFKKSHVKLILTANAKTASS